MKNRSVTLSLLTATLFAVPALAADAPPAATPPPPPPGLGPQGPWREEMMKRFDQDQDGQLNDAERAAAREAMRERWGARAAKGHRFAPGRHGQPPEWMRRELHRWFAQQWGGPQGHGPRWHAGPAGPRGPMHAKLMQRFDLDQDGKLSEAERAALKQAAEERRAQHAQNRKDVLARFDQDGDGKLGDAERKSMKDAWQKFLQQQPVVKPAAK